ncbi:hypothetical protein NDU88_000141 [Pleurodeles waltl]|uniref:Uncharacterized protein n=1 Tax=Pleurodeles waltl TaxID=8319 RepID=A0AAV7PZD0_PLEWA|nr:hypothetical protein NDU88_000141 [Pleurodeles waltl]
MVDRAPPHKTDPDPQMSEDIAGRRPREQGWPQADGCGGAACHPQGLLKHVSDPESVQVWHPLKAQMGTVTKEDC